MSQITLNIFNSYFSHVQLKSQPLRSGSTDLQISSILCLQMQDLNESPAHYSNDKVNLHLTCQLWASKGHYSTSLGLIFFGPRWPWPAVPTWAHCEGKMESMLGPVPDIYDMNSSPQWSKGACLEAVPKRHIQAPWFPAVVDSLT